MNVSIIKINIEKRIKYFLLIIKFYYTLAFFSSLLATCINAPTSHKEPVTRTDRCSSSGSESAMRKVRKTASSTVLAKETFALAEGVFGHSCFHILTVCSWRSGSESACKEGCGSFVDSVGVPILNVVKNTSENAGFEFTSCARRTAGFLVGLQLKISATLCFFCDFRTVWNHSKHAAILSGVCAPST